MMLAAKLSVKHVASMVEHLIAAALAMKLGSFSFNHFLVANTDERTFNTVALISASAVIPSCSFCLL